MMSKLLEQNKGKLHWLEMGIPYAESPDKNPNAMVFDLAMLWKDVEPLLKRIAELEAEISVYGQAIALCDSTDPNNPVMDGDLYRKAMALLNKDSGGG